MWGVSVDVAVRRSPDRPSRPPLGGPYRDPARAGDFGGRLCGRRPARRGWADLVGATLVPRGRRRRDGGGLACNSKLDASPPDLVRGKTRTRRGRVRIPSRATCGHVRGQPPDFVSGPIAGAQDRAQLCGHHVCAQCSERCGVPSSAKQSPPAEMRVIVRVGACRQIFEGTWRARVGLPFGVAPQSAQVKEPRKSWLEHIVPADKPGFPVGPITLGWGPRKRRGGR